MNKNLLSITILFIVILLFANCRKELTVDIIPLSDERFSPSDKITIYKNKNKISMDYITIAKLVLNGGEYEERLQKAVYSAKKSGGDAVIIKADQYSSGYQQDAMVAEIIKFVVKNSNNTKNNVENESINADGNELQDEEYEEDSYQNRYE